MLYAMFAASCSVKTAVTLGNDSTIFIGGASNVSLI